MALTALERALQNIVEVGSGLADSQVIWSDAQNRPTGTYIALALLDESAPAVDESTVAHNPLVLADDVIELLDPAADRATLTAHLYTNVDGPVQITTTGSLTGTGLAPLTNYWLITTPNFVKFATTRANAIAAVSIDITGAGTGVHTIVDTASTRRKGQEITYVVRGQRRRELQLQCFAGPATGTDTAHAILSRVQQSIRLPSQRARLDTAGIGVIGFEDIQNIPAIANRVVFEARAVTVFAFNVVATVSETGTDIKSARVTRTTVGLQPVIKTIPVGPQ